MSTSNIFSFFKFKNFFLLLSLLSFLFVSPLSAAEEAGSKVVLVLDASGSMWQKIGKKTKIEIAREVIGGIIKDWDPNAYLGLTAYGHRKKGDCKDIESLISVSKVNPGAFMKTINAINPKGKTPLTQAVLVAAKELKYSEEKATVILISDGKETCNADPCAVGNDLEKAGVDFTAHVVGFDVSDKIGMTQLQCLAKNTGGQFFAAKDASELKKALDIVVKKTAKGPNVKLTAIPKEGAKPFSEDVYWTVYPVGDDGKPAKKYVDSGFGDPKHFTLPAGRYLADVRVGKGKAKTEFEVTSDETTEKTVVVGVGYAQLTAIPKEGAEPFSEDVYWTVYPVGDDGKPAKKYVDSGFGDPKHFTLPAGRYLADVRVGKGKAKTEFEVTSDETTEKTVVVGVGYAQLTAIPKEGAEPFSEDV
ncbi:MAG TPA: VWA domain-containing protein, partial [Nitrospinota bacterium]|nr:VWA domain-containing protein [Nitrospinota bacterium]